MASAVAGRSSNSTRRPKVAAAGSSPSLQCLQDSCQAGTIEMRMTQAYDKKAPTWVLSMALRPKYTPLAANVSLLPACGLGMLPFSLRRPSGRSPKAVPYPAILEVSGAAWGMYIQFLPVPRPHKPDGRGVGRGSFKAQALPQSSGGLLLHRPAAVVVMASIPAECEYNAHCWSRRGRNRRVDRSPSSPKAQGRLGGLTKG